MWRLKALRRPATAAGLLACSGPHSAAATHSNHTRKGPRRTGCCPLTFFGGSWWVTLGSGKSGSVGMAHCPLQLLMAWGVLPLAWSVRRPLMGTCGTIAGS